MTIACHRSHTFDLDAIQPGQWVLDAGCRDLTLAADLAARGINVLAIDADELHGHTYPSSSLPGTVIIEPQLALVGHDDIGKELTLDASGNPYAFSLYTAGVTRKSVKTITIDGLMQKHGIATFALVKLDIEGAEYSVMRDIAVAAIGGLSIAKQVAVEYHEHCGIYPSLVNEAIEEAKSNGIDCETARREMMHGWYLGIDAVLKAGKYRREYSDGPSAGGGRLHWTDSLYVHNG